MSRMIPIMPCRSIDGQAEFYGALGFTVTLRQTRPNPYLEVRRDGIVLQFYGLGAHEPGSRFDTCYALLDADEDIDALHAAFRAGLKASIGRVPTRGIPRIGALGDLSDGVRQFLLTDPAGNQLRIGRPRVEPEDAALTSLPQGRLGRALGTAALLAGSKEDPVTAIRVLDPVLDDARASAAPIRVRALVLRAELAATMDDVAHARSLLAEAASTPLTDSERGALADSLARAADVANTLGA